MKFIINESKLEKIAINWLNKNYGDLTPYKTKKYSDFIFYLKNGNIIFDYNKNYGYVHISYDEVWSFLESFFNMEYNQIQDITKKWLEEHYKLRVTTTMDSLEWVELRWRNITN